MIYVIGSGPTGIASAQVLVKSGLPVTLIDGGIDLDPDRRALVERLKQQDWKDWTPSEIEKLKENFLSDRQGVQLKLLYGSDFPYREVDTVLPRRNTRLGHISPTLARGGFRYPSGEQLFFLTLQRTLKTGRSRSKTLHPGTARLSQCWGSLPAATILKSYFLFMVTPFIRFSPAARPPSC